MGASTASVASRPMMRPVPAQPGEQAVNAGIGGLPPFAGRHGGEERLLELEGEDRPMEGVGDYGGGVLKQAQKFLGARVKDQPRGAVDLPPCARQLEDRPAGALGQRLGVGGGLAGVGDEIAEYVLARLLRRARPARPSPLRSAEGWGPAPHGPAVRQPAPAGPAPLFRTDRAE